ncbi:MAG: SusC/RagA family TonB-linked outer membrane protein [Segetibacter sp.]|nr:SusC/RagA family TonB-linked outer membrane protein [Segetibacter sp.]
MARRIIRIMRSSGQYCQEKRLAELLLFGMHPNLELNTTNKFNLTKIYMTTLLPVNRILQALLLPLFLIGSLVNAQSQTVSGIVSSFGDNKPLQGVSVQVKGKTNGTATDVKGHYILRNISASDSIFFSFIGFQSKTVAVNNSTEISTSLQMEASSLDQVVVVGYGTQKKSDLTGSIARVDAKIFQNQSVTQLTDMLAGTVAGFISNQSTSAAGGGSMQIRGQKSLNASNDPMIVVDGAIYNGSITDINPMDIETIDILKDASSAAVYGARAANGVIIITTTKGKTGKYVINFSTKIGMTEAAHDFKPFDAKGYLDYRRDVLRGWGTGLPDYYFFNPNDLPQGVTLDQWRKASNNPQSDNTLEWLGRLRFFPTEIKNYVAGKSVDWYDKVMQKGIRQSYDLSLSGGSDKFTYFWSGGYDNNEGIIAGDQWSTVRTRLNFDFKLTNWLNIGMNSSFSTRNEGGVVADLAGMYSSSPYGSEYDSTGKLNWYPGDYTGQRNPLINNKGQSRSNRTNSLFSNLYTKVRLPFGLDYQLSFQPHYQFAHDYNFWPSATTIIGGSTHQNGYGTREESRQYEWIIDNILHWKKKFGPHNLDLTLLYSGEAHQDWYSLLTNENFKPNQNLGFDALQFGTNPSLTNNDTKTTGAASMARMNYSLLDKYLLTLSIRRDSYSAFGQKHPSANFPAAAFAWKISEEKFFKIDWINQMKLRLSWGSNGNRSIGAYSSLAQVVPNLYYNGSAVVVGVSNNSLANPDLAWERTASVNMGLDFGLLKNRLSGTAEFYNMTTTNLLMTRILPSITGFNSITTNLGAVKNKGFELTLNSVNIRTHDFNWNSSVVFSMNRNKIKNLFGDYKDVVVNGQTIKQEVPDYTNGWFPGQAIDVVWNYKTTGIWQVKEAAQAAVYRMVPGDIKSLDVNKDGTYQALDDKMFIGYSQPRYRLGLRNDFTLYKNLTLSFFIRADLGQIGAMPEALHNGSEGYDRININALPYWTPDNPTNDFPRLLTNINSYGGGIMFYKPRSFVRIQDLSVSYNLLSLKRLHLTTARVFASVRNLYTFDKWPGWDPESGNLPMPKTFTVGLNFSF